MKKLKKLWNRIRYNKVLKLSERQWGLFRKVPETGIEIIFPFIDQVTTAGYCYSAITQVGSRIINRSTIAVNLDNAGTEDTIIDTIWHEYLHAAINNAIKDKKSGFTEKVIDEWIKGSKIHRTGLSGKCYLVWDSRE